MNNISKDYVCPLTLQELHLEEGILVSNNKENSYKVLDEVINFTYPAELHEADQKELDSYNNAFTRYDRGVSWVFESLNSDEDSTRQKMIALLGLKKGMKVLEVGAGTGKDTSYILKEIGESGIAFVSDLSPNMLNLAKDRFKNDNYNINYFLANGSYLPFADNTFDAVFHFGGINTFSERKRAFAEFTRVAKVGANIVVGDESVAPWLRNKETYQILMKANPMFADEVPLNDLPSNIENFELHWIFGFAYYVLKYNKTNVEPLVNVDLPIPNKDFIDNWALRAKQK